MEILVGVSWLFYWLLIDTFKVDGLKSALVTGIVFILVGVVWGVGPRYWSKRP